MGSQNRRKPQILECYECLSVRKKLAKEDEWYLKALVKGFEGELLFDSLQEGFSFEGIVLKDVSFTMNRRTVQMDSLFITGDRLYLYEVKNYEGRYVLEGDQMLNVETGNEITDPMIQLKRTASLLRQLLNRLGVRLKVEAYLVFMNPDFMLYQMPKDAPYLFLSQLEGHFIELAKVTKTLTPMHYELESKLNKMRLIENKHDDLPIYSYDELKKGMICFECRAFIDAVVGRMSVCQDCGFKERTATSVLRHIHEYRTLFPERKLTTSRILEWCNYVPSPFSVKNTLKQSFHPLSSRRWRYYIQKE